MEIEITEDDLKNGNWETEHSCPVCLAVKRYVRPEVFIHLDYSTLLLWDDFGNWIALTPDRKLIDQMRLKQKSKPFSINIQIPEAFLVPQQNRNAS